MCILMHTSTPPTQQFLSRGQHTVVLYVVILLCDERSWSLPGNFAHMNDLYIRSFDCGFAVCCIHRHGMISAQT